MVWTQTTSFMTYETHSTWPLTIKRKNVRFKAKDDSVPAVFMIALLQGSFLPRHKGSAVSLYTYCLFWNFEYLHVSFIPYQIRKRNMKLCGNTHKLSSFLYGYKRLSPRLQSSVWLKKLSCFSCLLHPSISSWWDSSQRLLSDLGKWKLCNCHNPQYIDYQCFFSLPWNRKHEGCSSADKSEGFCFKSVLNVLKHSSSIYNWSRAATLNLTGIFTIHLVTQLVKTLPAMQKTWVQPLGWEDPLEKEPHSSILAGEFHGVTKSQTPLNDFHYSQCLNL